MATLGTATEGTTDRLARERENLNYGRYRVKNIMLYKKEHDVVILDQDYIQVLLDVGLSALAHFPDIDQMRNRGRMDLKIDVVQ